jgi:hypothetical protein
MGEQPSLGAPAEAGYGGPRRRGAAHADQPRLDCPRGGDPLVPLPWMLRFFDLPCLGSELGKWIFSWSEQSDFESESHPLVERNSSP